MTEGDEFRGNRKNGTATPGAAGGQWRVIVDGGPPPSSEGVLLTGVEKDLQAKLPRYGAVHVLSVTSRGNREWTAYAPSHDWMHSWAPAFASRWFADHTCQISADEDAGWTVYQAFSGRR